MKKILLLIIFLMSLLTGCKGGNSNNAFEFLDAPNTTTTDIPPVNLKISQALPSDAEILLASTERKIFSISLEEQDTNAIYNFILDPDPTTGVGTSLQNSSLSFYELSASSISVGTHILKVVVSNSSSSDFYTFHIRKNSPISLVSFTPNLSGDTVNCNQDTITFTTNYIDADVSDSTNLKWYIDGNLVGPATTGAIRMNDLDNKIASMSYSPDCSQSGLHFIRIDHNDGHEITSQTWSIQVIAPIILSINDFTPTSNPVVLTSTTNATFAVSLAVPDADANYQFILDGVTTLQNNRKAYYNLSGNPLSIGDHTLTVHATNTTSTATKIFNVRRNSPPATTGYSPAFSGTMVSCGSAPITLYADLFDANGDSLNVQWTLDDNISGNLVASNTPTKALATFNPLCGLAGTRVIKAIINDGYESITLTWSVTVSSPVPIVISAYTPSSNPTIMLSNTTTTFSIALTNSDQNVNYSFVLKNLTSLVSTTLQSGTVPFYNLLGSSLTPGLYELTATASNGSSSDSHVFTIRKNSPPEVPPIPLTFSPALTGTILNCNSSSQVFSMPILDSDHDIVDVTWYVDNFVNTTEMTTNNTQTNASATYTPTCATVGTKLIRLDVYDGYETTSKTWTITVVNPTIATITSYSPSTDPVHVLSTGVQSFTLSATGKGTLNYEWRLDGNLLSGQTNPYVTLTAASLSTGNHTLIGKASDSDSNDTHTFNIIKNAPPTLGSLSPSNLTPKININTYINFSTTFSDDNNDSLTIAWKINGSVVSGGNPNGSISTVGNSTTLTFSPTASTLGQNTITLEVSDGKEVTSQSWTLTINYFSDICNNLGAGKICTLLGRPGRGSNVNVLTNPTEVMIRPNFIAQYGTTSSYFVSDELSHTVWFYNKSSSPVTILGQTIAANNIKAILGVGLSGTGTSGVGYDDFALSTPKGLAWDATNERLFITEEGNGGRLLMLDSSGTVTVIMTSTGSNNSTYNANGRSLPSGTWCATPRGLAYDESNNQLYIACAASSTVKVIDTSNASPTAWTSSILSGANSSTAGVIVNNTNDGSNGYSGTNGFSSPYSLKLDKTNQILYVTDSGHCKVKAINLTGVAKTNFFFNGTTTLNANSTITISGINGTTASACTTYATGTYSTQRYNGGPMHVDLYMTGSSLKGFFVSDYNSHRIAFINNTSTSFKIGNAQLSNVITAATIWNSAGTNSYFMPCTSASSTTCYLYNPHGLFVYNNSKLHVGDYSNYRVRTLDITVDNGTVADDLGFDKKANFAGNGGTSSENVQFNLPLHVYYDSYTNKLLVSDFGNYRIRAVSLITGKVDPFISNGYGDANNSNVDPTALGTRGPRGIVNYQNHYIYADNQGQNCLLRAWNTYASTQTILGVSTYANAVQTIAGNWANGCGTFDPLATVATNSYAKLNQPTSIATDGTNIYFTNTNAHVILKVDQNGNMSVFSGQYNVAGAANGTGTAYNSGSIKYSYPTGIIMDPIYPTNLMILDQTSNSTATKIRYINLSGSQVTVFGVQINNNEIKTIYTAPDNHGADLAAFDSQICYSTGGDYNYNNNGNATNTNHNVVCLDRTDVTSTLIKRFGRNPSTYLAHGHIQDNQEEEGASAFSSSFAGPSGLAFDNEGNLYITERDSHVIRMIKKWWN